MEVTRETHAERAEREQVLEGFKQRVRAVRELLDMRPLQL